jgi:hypothetical protein
VTVSIAEIQQRHDEAWRRGWCERAGLGFSLVGLFGLQKAEEIFSEEAA